MSVNDHSKQLVNARTTTEKVGDNLAVEGGLALVGAFSGNPLGVLLPIFGKALASQRARNRVDSTLREIDVILRSQEEALRRMSDAQFQVINDTIVAILNSASREKLAFLKNVIRNGLSMPNLQPQESAVLSRLVRDISPTEARFLVEHYHYRRIRVSALGEVSASDVLTLGSGGDDELVVTGLMSLGLLIPAGEGVDNLGYFRFSNTVAKLVALLKPV